MAGGEVGDGEFRIPIPGRWEESLAGRTKRFGDTLKHVLPHIPQEMAELQQFSIRSKNFTKILSSPWRSAKAKLLIPLLT